MLGFGTPLTKRSGLSGLYASIGARISWTGNRPRSAFAEAGPALAAVSIEMPFAHGCVLAIICTSGRTRSHQNVRGLSSS